MTTHIIYTRYMEPITAIGLPRWRVEKLKRHRFCDILVEKDVSAPLVHADYVRADPIKRCQIFAWSLNPLILVTDDEEEALELESKFLAGQSRAVTDVYREGWGKGAEAMGRMMKGMR